MNSNKELLDWAVENIKKWDDTYNYLYSDDSGYFYGKREFEKNEFSSCSDVRWVPSVRRDWDWVLRTYKDETNNPPVQVITKQEWLDAKKEKEDMSNGFSLKDLKTGHRVTMDNGKVYAVFLDADLKNCNGSKNVLVCTEGSTWYNLEDFDEDLFCGNKGIIEVRSFWAHNLNSGYESVGELLWERPVKSKQDSEKENLQKVIDKLQQDLQNAQQQLDNLGGK